MKCGTVAALVLLAQVAVAQLARAEAANSKEQTRASLRASFDQVKRYIEDARIQPDRSPEEVFELVNAALIDNSAQSAAKYPGGREAAGLIVAASKATGCNEATLDALKRIGLGSDRAATRLDNIWSDYVNFYAHSAAKQCADGQLLAAKFARANASSAGADYQRKLAPVDETLLLGGGVRVDPTNQALVTEDEIWARILATLAGNMTSEQIVANFERVYAEHLAEPCAAYVASPLGDLADTADALGYFVGFAYSKRGYKPLWDFFEALPAGLQDNLFRLYVCQAVALDKVDTSAVKQFIGDYGERRAGQV